MSVFKDKLRKMVKSLGNAAVDLTSLEATTLSGEISHFVDATGHFNLKKVNNLITENSTVEREIQIIAHTHTAFDQDTLLFAKKDMTPEERDLFKLHQEMLASARTSRTAFLHFLKEVTD